MFMCPMRFNVLKNVQIKKDERKIQVEVEMDWDILKKRRKKIKEKLYGSNYYCVIMSKH